MSRPMITYTMISTTVTMALCHRHPRAVGGLKNESRVKKLVPCCLRCGGFLPEVLLLGRRGGVVLGLDAVDGLRAGADVVDVADGLRAGVVAIMVDDVKQLGHTTTPLLWASCSCDTVILWPQVPQV